MNQKISLINYVIAIFLLTLLYSGTSASEVTNSANETNVTDEEVRSAYEAYAKNWSGDEYDLRHILAYSHEEALSALKRIQDG